MLFHGRPAMIGIHHGSIRGLLAASVDIPVPQQQIALHRAAVLAVVFNARCKSNHGRRVCSVLPNQYWRKRRRHHSKWVIWTESKSENDCRACNAVVCFASRLQIRGRQEPKVLPRSFWIASPSTMPGQSSEGRIGCNQRRRRSTARPPVANAATASVAHRPRGLLRAASWKKSVLTKIRRPPRTTFGASFSALRKYKCMAPGALDLFISFLTHMSMI